MSDDSRYAAPERLLLKANGIYRWRGRTMGRTTLRARVGMLLLTDRRLVFLSSGRTDAWSRMALAGLGLGPDVVVKTATAADAMRTVAGWIHDRFTTPTIGDAVDVTATQLSKDGSLSVPLADLVEFGVTLRRFSNFLWIAYRTPSAADVGESAFANQTAIPGGAVWESTIRAARDAVRPEPPTG
jgi:hypothetical protein